MRISLSILLLLLVCQCFCDPIMDKLTEIDNQMNNGKVEYTVISKDKRVGTQEMILSYLEGGIFKKEIIFEKTGKLTEYYDGKDYISVNDGTPGSSSVQFRNKDSIEKAYPYSKVHPHASCTYGRGLSLLNLSNISINDNILTGEEHGWQVKAYLDPKYDYACYKLEIKVGKVVTDTLINSDPILVDNKYYVYTKSKSKHPYQLRDLDDEIIISSITFVPPNKKDIEFDWKKSELPVVDTRVNDLPVGYSRDSLEKDISSDKLLEKSKKNVTEIYGNEPLKIQNPNTKKFLLLISFVVILFLLIFFVKKITKKS
ncbi:MAG: hypothetical protein IJS60_05395 [Abditibacteriota bacterium]|nr:hypothetical protein [Abditibacteriota bacterium]